LCSNSSRNKNSRDQRKARTGRLKKLPGHEGEARMPPPNGQSKSFVCNGLGKTGGDCANRCAARPEALQDQYQQQDHASRRFMSQD
jgi:hypothetical protein